MRVVAVLLLLLAPGLASAGPRESIATETARLNPAEQVRAALLEANPPGTPQKRVLAWLEARQVTVDPIAFRQDKRVVFYAYLPDAGILLLAFSDDDRLHSVSIGLHRRQTP